MSCPFNVHHQTTSNNRGNELPIQCPPLDYQQQQRQAFRFVFLLESNNSVNNFLPVLIINPKGKLIPDNPEVQCQGYALSFFDTAENAKLRYGKLTRKRKALRKSLGTHLAQGVLQKDDGLMSRIGPGGHFSLHELKTVDLSGKFQIISEL
jgi:hypothetical protein